MKNILLTVFMLIVYAGISTPSYTSKIEKSCGDIYRESAPNAKIDNYIKCLKKIKN